MSETDLAAARVAIVTHVYGTGPAFQLEAYLRSRTAALLFVGHPFPFATDTRSFLRAYHRGVLLKERHHVRWRGPDLGFYLRDLLLTLWWPVRFGPVDLFIGTGVLNAWAGVVLKRLGRVRTLVFYAIDSVPRRFPNRFLNAIYHVLERGAVAGSDCVWNLSPVMVGEREKRGLSSVFRRKQITVPIGTVIRDSSPPGLRDRFQIVYFGHLRAGQGLERLVEILPAVIAKVPNAHLLLIGGGVLEHSLREKARRLHMEKYVRITGFLEDPGEAYALLRSSAVAVAPYADVPENFTRYTDPGKIKDYLANGLPVVITMVPQIAREIAERGCGIAVPDDPDALTGALVRLLTDDSFWRSCGEHAIEAALEVTWDRVFSRAIAQTYALSVA